MPGEEITAHTHVQPSSNASTPIPRPDVPGYEILGEIGRGGMGVVYRARQIVLNRAAALKMILAGSHAGAAERERFRREAEAAAALQHPHIVQIFEVGEASGHPYLALELVEGGSLAQYLKGSPWPAADAANLIERLARAMHFAHEHGIVHRDLKPGNILISFEFSGTHKRSEQRIPQMPFVPKITDFGLAKRLDESPDAPGTKTGAILGTPSYIAPEQASGKAGNIGPPTDVYALGAILYELLTGRPPFRGETPLETVLQVTHDDPVPPKQLNTRVPRDLETICLKCLGKQPARRYATALALADDLHRFLRSEPIQARPLSAWGRTMKWARRHPARAALAIVSTVSLAAFVTVLALAYARIQDAIADKDAEATAAREARDRASTLAEENDAARRDAVRQADLLKNEVDRNRRAAYALQLAQVAAIVERDPLRAAQILDDENRCPPSLRDFTWHYLRRLCKREELVYKANDSPLFALASSPDSALAATAGADANVRLWDSRTGLTLAVLHGHTKKVTSVAFRPDGRAIAAAGADGSVRFWSVPTRAYILARGDPRFVVFAQRALPPTDVPAAVTLENAHEGGVNTIAFAPDGRTLASGGQDGVVRFWELGEWRAAETDVALGGGAGAWAWSVGHARTNTSARPIWEMRSLDGNTQPVQCLAFAPGGHWLADGLADGHVRVWTADGSSLVRELHPQSAEPVRDITFTPDGRRLAVTNNGVTPQILVWNTDEWDHPPRRLLGHNGAIYTLAVGPEGMLLASAGYDRTVRLWDLEIGRERSVLQGHTRSVQGVAFNANHRTLITAGEDGTARVWQIGAQASDTVEIEKSGETLRAAAVSANGETLIAGGPDRMVRVWALDVDSRGRRIPEAMQVRGVLPVVPLIEFELPSPVSTVAASPDGRVVLAGTAEGVYVWRLPQLRLPDRLVSQGLKLTLPIREPHRINTPRPVMGLVVAADGRTLAVVSDVGVRLWDLPLMKPMLAKPLVESKDVQDVSFDSSGRRLAVALSHSLQIVDAKTGEVLSEALNAHGTETIIAVAFAPNGKAAATADQTGAIKLWSIEDGKLGKFSALAAHTETVHSLAFTPNGRTLATGGWDRGVVLWDPVAGQERASLPDHADRLLRVQFVSNGSALITVSRDGTVKRFRTDLKE